MQSSVQFFFFVFFFQNNNSEEEGERNRKIDGSHWEFRAECCLSSALGEQEKMIEVGEGEEEQLV